MLRQAEKLLLFDYQFLGSKLRQGGLPVRAAVGESSNVYCYLCVAASASVEGESESL